MLSRAVSWLKRPQGLFAALWALTLIGLPLTSFPLITNLTGATVAPFSAIPLAVLLVLWFVPYLLRRGSLPKETLPFAAFYLLAVALAALAFFQVDSTFRDKTLLGHTLRTFVPVVMGAAFFLLTAAWHKDSPALRRTLQWIHVGGFLLLAWSVMQAVVVIGFGWQYPTLMEWIRTALVTQSNMAGNSRLAGLTWEPSWFAHQLNMLYLPLWLAASYQRTTVFPRLWKISVENIFLVVGVVVFFLSSPRIGGAAFMLVLLYLFLKFNVAVYRWVIRRLTPLWTTLKQPGLIKLGVGVVLVIVFIGVYVGFSALVLKVVSERDWRVALLLKSPLSQSEIQRISALDENTLFYLGLRFAFMERTVYWMDGWRIFNDFPLLGVGLGNAGFYFIPRLPAVGWSSIEVRAIVNANAGLPNIKSIWYRLLAETGLVGFSIFITWLLVLWSSASKSLHSASPLRRTLPLRVPEGACGVSHPVEGSASHPVEGSRDDTLRTLALAGQLALLAYVFEGFSVDTFGLPYLFIMAGLIASAGWVIRHPSGATQSG